MRATWLHCVTVVITPEAEDAVVELLGRVFGQPASVYLDLRRHIARASVYLADGGKPNRAQLVAVRAGFAEINACGLDAGSGRVTVKRVRREDWAESWKRHFKPMEIGGSLLIKPSWNKRKPRRGQQMVTLDPGLSFGTGQHATTSFCLWELASRRHAEATQSFLDIGTGSGILAIAAAKLGYSPVEAFDFDPDAVRVAKENVRVNGVRRVVCPVEGDITKFPVKAPRRFDLVCANLMADLLIQESRRIVAHVAPGGVLVLAGILTGQFDGVRRQFERAGLKLHRTKREKEWRSGAFQMAD